MLNNVCLVGRFTQNPELKKTQSDKSVVSFCLAVQRNGGADKVTDFLDCVAWNKTAEFITKYFSKGNLISLIGSVQTRNYVDKENKKRKAVEILVESVHFVESKKQNVDETPVNNSEFLDIDNSEEDLPF
ncbi:MAG: single-stranded DNA-binding protein [Lachnospiraceae bacterium]|nr:single-stranded DNA-binding protein [Lachnospiraceae bacterium]